MIRRLTFIVFSVCLMAGILGGCTTNASQPSPDSSSEPIENMSPLPELKEYDLGELAIDICETNAFSDILDTVSSEITVGLYGIDSDDIEDSCLMCSTGATTEEIGLFKCVDEEAAARVQALAEARIQAQKTAYESYAPEEMPKLDDAVVETNGLYVFYVVSTDSDKIENVL